MGSVLAQGGLSFLSYTGFVLRRTNLSCLHLLNSLIYLQEGWFQRDNPVCWPNRLCCGIFCNLLNF